MTFGEAVKTYFSKFLTHSGRASRPGYWIFFLFIGISNLIAGIIDWQFFIQVALTGTGGISSVAAMSSQPAQNIVTLIVNPTLLFVFVSPLLMLWGLTRPSQPGTNQYGPNPYEVAQ